MFLLTVHCELGVELRSRDVQPTSKLSLRVLHNHVIRKDEVLGGFERSIADLLKSQNTGDLSKSHIRTVVLQSDLQLFADITIDLEPLDGKGNIPSRGSITLRVQDNFGSGAKSYMPMEDEVHSALEPSKVVAIVDTISGDVSRANKLVEKAKGGPDFLVKKLDPVFNLLDELSKVRSTSFSLFLRAMFLIVSGISFTLLQPSLGLS